MTNEQKNQVAAMNASGMSIDEIVLDSAHRIIAAAKEKEPAAAATATDSREITVQVKDSTKTAESQALESAKAKLLAIWSSGGAGNDIIREI